MRNPITFTLFSFILIITVSQSFAQSKRLSYVQAYEGKGPKLLQALPQIQGWLDEDTYLELKREDGNPIIYAVDAKKGTQKLYRDLRPLIQNLPDGYNLFSAKKSEDGKAYLFQNKGDIAYYDGDQQTFRQLTYTEEEEKNPRFSPDAKYISFTRAHNLYVVDVDSGEEMALTTDGNDYLYNGWSSWVYMEEILGRSSRHAAYWWSPDSRHIAFLQFDDRPVPQFPIYRADGVHGELEIQRYPKPGDKNPKVKLGVSSSGGWKH